ncbi:hypothetical protein Golomagni_01170 [Golovinomyces magnicellulatus]|nr:hypothetical protein Golomagni_01170 [Golovinomyces magnicellulatus]
MAALLQSYPQPSGTMSMLQTQSSSAAEIIPKGTQAQISHHSNNNKSGLQRNSFHGIGNGIPLSNYRGQSLVASIAPYAFTSTPELNVPSQNSILRPDFETTHSSTTLRLGRSDGLARLSSSTSVTSMPSEKLSIIPKTGFANDSTPSRLNRSGSAAHPASPSPNNLPSSNHQAMKSSPGRYRRTPSQSNELNLLGSSESRPNNEMLEPQSICNFKEFSLQMPQVSDFMYDNHPRIKQHRSENLKSQKHRHGSLQKNSINIPTQGSLSSFNSFQPDLHQLRTSNDHNEQLQIFNSSVHSGPPHRRDRSVESARSPYPSKSKNILARQEDDKLGSKPNLQSESHMIKPSHEKTKTNAGSTESIEIPTRVSSSDAVKRSFNPSPLSKPVEINSESVTPTEPSNSVSGHLPENKSDSASNPIVTDGSNRLTTAQLPALKKKDEKKSKNSRLRRAFSFGSAAELNNMSLESRAVKDTVSDVSVRKEKFQDDLDAEHTKIAQQQEAGGIGSGIYTGQGNVFSGSMDNLSISSTASSASIMIRKMGKGMKKSTRSIVGLFRPKHIAGLSSADTGPPLASETHVSRVNVEAELGKSSNKTSDLPAGCSKSFPMSAAKKSLVADVNATGSERLGLPKAINKSNMKGFLGEKERAEALSAVKKGILKRTENSFLVASALNSNTKAFQIPLTTMGNDKTNSTALSPLNDDQQRHQRARSATFSKEEFFTTSLRFNRGLKSNHDIRLSSSAKRNTTFSPRIQFHDTWPSGEYDRRGEIATCNRLTPMLAQQIKEELNTFKMEMEVHEKSKIYTHFF